MEQRYIQDGREGDVVPAHGLEREPVGPRRGDDELLGAEERAEVLVKVLLLLPAAAVRGRPQVHRVGGDAHVPQTQAADHHQHDAHRDHRQGTAHAERAPAAEHAAEEVLKALSYRLAARHLTWKQ